MDSVYSSLGALEQTSEFLDMQENTLRQFQSTMCFKAFGNGRPRPKLYLIVLPKEESDTNYPAVEYPESTNSVRENSSPIKGSCGKKKPIRYDGPVQSSFKKSCKKKQTGHVHGHSPMGYSQKTKPALFDPIYSAFKNPWIESTGNYRGQSSTPNTHGAKQSGRGRGKLLEVDSDEDVSPTVKSNGKPYFGSDVQDISHWNLNHLKKEFHK